jgi:hypothetical protein
MAMTQANDSTSFTDGLTPGHVALFRQLAEETAKKTVTEMFTAMGLDTRDPIAAQGDFSVLREVTKLARDDNFRADRDWVRRTRVRSEGIFGKVVVTSAVLVLTGAATVLAAGVRTILGYTAPH